MSVVMVTVRVACLTTGRTDLASSGQWAERQPAVDERGLASVVPPVSWGGQHLNEVSVPRNYGFLRAHITSRDSGSGTAVVRLAHRAYETNSLVWP